MKNRNLWLSILVVFILLLTSCAAVDEIEQAFSNQLNNNEQVEQATPEAVQVETNETADPTPVQPVVIESGLLADYEQALTEIYDGVNPSVVSIVAATPAGGSQGSGFVWDLDGHIVTNNHVVAGATFLQVEFYDGTIVEAEIIGSDGYSDLAVLRVDVSEDFLLPVRMADSNNVQVGHLAIAIGNPFALENTMTVGIVSALGRTIPAGQVTLGSPSYSIPDIIQTDAPINPGNSGGVLVNDQAEVIGVTAAIRSTTQANAGIGFVIPSNIVSRIVPVLIDEGQYQHPYIGVTGTQLTPNLAEAMGLNPEQRGAVVMAVTEGGPADEAGLQGSDNQTTINGQQVSVGGDVIIGIEGEPIRSMDELIAYLFSHTAVGDEVTLRVLRDGEEMEVEVTLEARPAFAQEEQVMQPPTGSGVYLGISGLPITPPLAELLGLPEDMNGVLVEEVSEGSPADEAGLQGGTEEIEVQGQTIIIGGDIITAFEGHPISSVQDLVVFLGMTQAGEEVSLSILRDGEEMELTVTLQERPRN